MHPLPCLTVQHEEGKSCTFMANDGDGLDITDRQVLNVHLSNIQNTISSEMKSHRSAQGNLTSQESFQGFSRFF